MTRFSLIVFLLAISCLVKAQVEIPATHCGCKQIKKDNFTVCVNDTDYKTVWTAARIEKTQIEDHIYLPPDKDFFPGLAKINTLIWNKLENQVKYWAIEFDSVFVVTGYLTINDTATSTRQKYYYKAILKGCEGDAIGFLVGANNTSKDILAYSVSVDRLEGLTGFDFFPSLRTDLQAIIESGFNTDFWDISVP